MTTFDCMTTSESVTTYDCQRCFVVAAVDVGNVSETRDRKQLTCRHFRNERKSTGKWENREIIL